MNRKPFKFLLILTVLILASLACGRSSQEATALPQATTAPTAAPTNTPEPAVQLGEEIRSEEGGFTVKTVPGYATEDFFGSMFITAPDANPDTGPLFILLGGVNEETKTLDQLFSDFVAESGADVTVTNQRNVTVAGVTGLSADLSGDQEGVAVSGRLVLLLPSPTHQFALIGFAPTTRWESETSAIFEAMLTSLSFFEPVVTSFDPGSFDPGAESDLGTFRQWATSATASSQYGSTDYSAMAATGAPDVYPECSDETQAWATSTGDGRDWLELTYAIPVIPTEINIYQTHRPDQVVSVEVFPLDGGSFTVYTGEPYEAQECPFILSIPVNLDVLVSSIRITIDQRVLNWTEIDAVELVGLSGDDLSTLPPTEPAVEPVTFDPPPGFLWRLGGESGIRDDQFSALGGMAVDSGGFLYVADNIHGIWIYDANGNFVDNIDHTVFNNVNDVAVSTQGGGYIVASAWGNNSIFVMDYNGTILTQFGSEGNGPGQFGGFSPESVTMDLQNNIYVLDRNKDNNGTDFERVQVFDINGNFKSEWRINEDFFSGSAIQFWAGPTSSQDRIYVLGFVGGKIIEYDLQGNKLREIGASAIGFKGPQDLAIDQAGNFYVSVWSPDSVQKLDHDGNLLAEWGVQVDVRDRPWPEGGFYSINGVAVSPDGSRVYANDWSGAYAYITAFEYR